MSYHLSEEEIQRVTDTFMQVGRILEEEEFSEFEFIALITCFFKIMDEDYLFYMRDLINEIIKSSS